jgi:hypothetical protein
MPLAVTRDGSRILFMQGVEQPNPQLTYVMTAWATLLKKCWALKISRLHPRFDV